ncbi:alpha/beta hydrolase fold domain-containing protein [Brevibacillus reuszeri]|uniref:alpha/beta hydrolase fold domain-containing protein n=1 Tax=Brevibacillus reuszeri TaxID=54915 RepID=UPI003670E006
MKLIEDIPFCTQNGKPVCLDIIMQEDPPEHPMPAIIYIHGGGWMRGDKAAEGGRSWNARFAKHGFVCVNINHRLSGEASFPAQIHDVKAAVRWVRAHAREYSIDPSKIGVWGHSSGGHLASLLGTSASIAELEGTGGNEEVSSEVQAVCTLSGPTDLSKMGGWHDHPNSPDARLFGIETLTENIELVSRANPMRYIHKKTPPFFIVHGDADSIVPINQSELLYKALDDVSFLRIKGADHGLIGGNMSMDEILNSILAFFQKQLMGTKESEYIIKQSRNDEKNLIQYFLNDTLESSK